VLAIASLPSEQWLVTSSNGVEIYDSIVLAAPYHQTGILFPASLANVPQQPYEPVHVTLITTTEAAPSQAFFGTTSNSTLAPQTIFVTLEETKVKNVINVIEAIDQLSGTGPNGEDEFVFKLFSPAELSDATLNEIFNGNIGWTLRHLVCVLGIHTTGALLTCA
jgi:prenylcysteine oxidase / farnesylcysteine lyase